MSEPSIEIGRVEAIFRYPVKSMAGEALDAAALGWHGVDGDRRRALRRRDEHGAFPWLTASKLPDLVRFTPVARGDGGAPTHVRTPDGDELPIDGDALAAELGRRHGAPVEMMQLRHGIFDEAAVSVITSTTAHAICRDAGVRDDLRRFRPNVVVRSTTAVAFEEDAWIGGALVFGDADDAPVVSVTMRDLRCVMVNFDPDGGPHAPAVMKAIVRANQNHAGVYATVTRAGRVEVGQLVRLTARRSAGAGSSRSA